ncbi:MAG: murein biosynthesis integral membrane protein MurJ [Thermodesulfobacteriota bacterium]
MTRSLHRNVGIAFLIMTVSIFLSRIIGMLREMTIAHIAGVSGNVDAYQVAFIIPEILNHIAASGFLSVTFIPIFHHYLAENREAEGWEAFSAIFTTFGVGVLLLIILAEAAAPQLVQLLAPGLREPALQTAAVRMTRIILPAQFFFFCGGLFMAVQFAKGKFALPALAPLLYNIGIIAGGVLLGRQMGMEGFAWGVLAGAFAGNFAIQIHGARKAGMRLRFRVAPTHPDVIRYVKLTLPLMIGMTMTFSTEIFLKFFGSFLPPGNIAGLNYALRIMLALVGLFGQAAGVASYPYLSRLAAEKQYSEMNRLLNTTLRYMALLLPVSALLMVLRTEVVTILFQHGRFNTEATALTARLLLFLMTGAFAFAAQTVVVRGFYALQDTLLPAVFGTLAVLLSIPLYLLGLHFMGSSGVAAAISLSAILQVLILHFIWTRKTGSSECVRIYGFYGRMLLWALASGGLLEAFRKSLRSHVLPGGFLGSLTACLIVGAAFFLLMTAAGHYFHVPEIRALSDRIKTRLHRKG